MIHFSYMESNLLCMWSACNMWQFLLYFFFSCITLFTRVLHWIPERLQVFSQMQCFSLWPVVKKINEMWSTNTHLWLLTSAPCRALVGVEPDMSTGWPLNEQYCYELLHALWSKVGVLVFLSPNCPCVIPCTAPRLVWSFIILIWCNSAALQLFFFFFFASA